MSQDEDDCTWGDIDFDKVDAVVTALLAPSHSFNDAIPSSAIWKTPKRKLLDTTTATTTASAVTPGVSCFEQIVSLVPGKKMRIGDSAAKKNGADLSNADSVIRDPTALVAFCDGSCLGNGKKDARAGWACVFPHNEGWNRSAPLSGISFIDTRALPFNTCGTSFYPSNSITARRYTNK